MDELKLEADKSRLRKKISKIYDAFKKFSTTLGRGEVVFKFTVILPPVPTINFKEVGKINDFGTFVYDDDGEIVIDKLEPYLIIPKFYIIYDEEMIENLEWSQKPDYMWLESKIKDKIIKNFKNFRIDVSHFGKAVWRTFEKTNLDNTSDLWNPNFKNGILSESWDDVGYKDSQYVKDLEQNPISDEDYNRILKRAKALYFTFKEGEFTTQFQHPVSGENWAKGKTHYVLPDEPRLFIPEFRRFGGDRWDSEDERRSLRPRVSVADTEIKLYVIPTDNINVNERLHRIYTQYLIKNGDYYTLPPEEANSNGVNKIVDELRKNMHQTITKNFHKFNTRIGFFVR